MEKTMDRESMKRIAAKEALKFIRENEIVAMGSGTTVEALIDEMVKLNIKNVKFHHRKGQKDYLLKRVTKLLILRINVMFT